MSAAHGLDVERLRAETPGTRGRIHFNNAGAGLMPEPVVRAMREHLELEAQIGGYEAAELRAGQIRDFHVQLGRLLNASPANVAFATNATDAYSRALSSIPFEPGDVVLTTRNDYISNQIAFLSLHRRFGVELVRAPDAPGGGVDVEAFCELMRARRPRLAAVTHVPTNSGLVQPLAEIGRVAREREVLYLVDACQSLGQLPLDVAEIGCDFLSATLRKFLRGPRGTGVLYVSDNVLAAGLEPLFIDMYGARWTEPDRYEQVATAERFEDWEFPYAAVLGAAAAGRYALDLGVERTAERATALGALLRARLAELPRLRVLDRGPELCAIVTATADRVDGPALKAALTQRRINSDLSTRASNRIDFAAKQTDWALRLSPHYYNTEDEIEAVVEAVADCT